MFDLRRILSIVAIGAISLLGCATTYAVAASFPRNCVGCNFSGDDLHGQDFSSSTWVGADLARANLHGARLRNARLVGANFSNADLRDADFSGANCVGCNFAGAQLLGAHFDGARLTGSNFSGNSFSGMDDAMLRVLLGHCVGCNLSGSDVHGHDLHGIALVGISFRHSRASNVNFSGSTLCWYNRNDSASGREQRCDSFEGADVTGSNFQRITLCDTNQGSVSNCTPVDAETFKRLSGSPLEGATPP